MKFSVGYTTGASDQFLQEIARLKKDIKEVYFSWGTMPSGRNAQTTVATLTPWEAQAKHFYRTSICGRACDRACYIHLEEKGLLTKKFNHPFREKPDWELSTTQYETGKRED